MRPPAPLALSMGDPAGVGLEIAVAAWRSGAPVFALIADPDAAARACARAGAPAPLVIDRLEAAAAAFARALPVWPAVRLARPETPGQPDPDAAPAITGAIAEAVHRTLAGDAAAVVTLPIAKAPLMAAGFPHPGHTEYLEALTAAAPMAGPRGAVMMLAGPSLKVALATVHTPLAAVPARLTADRLGRVARILDAALRRDFGFDAPRIALCGLNPHAGEDGAIGEEEARVFNPLAARLRAEGLRITDAQPADSLFHEGARAGYDAALAAYHDQGLIPIKTLHFWDAVNLTLGLPIVRASPDHGTAFDIAGQGRARPDSLIAALTMAAAIAARRGPA